MNRRHLESWMWSEALSLLDEAQRLQRQFFAPGRSAPAAGVGARRACVPAWEPPVDVVETADALQVFVALPGVRSGDIELELQPGVLVIVAERAFPAAGRSARLHRMEIPSGRFERRIALPTHALQLERHQLADGCLVLTFRKKETT